MIKTFVLDTNVLLHSSHSLESFQDNHIAIPMAVIEELDKFKKNHDELGRNARRVIRTLDSLRRVGRLSEGVPMTGIVGAATGKLMIVSAQPGDGYEEFLKRIAGAGWNSDMTDNRILAAALLLQKKGGRVVFVSKDINLRLKADALGLKVADFEKETIDSDRLYTGFRSLSVPEARIDQFYREKRLTLPQETFFPNEFAVLSGTDGKHVVMGRAAAEHEIFLIDQSDRFHVGSLSPRNREQRMALELLLDPSVRLVTLVGGAGTGKTLLALAAGLYLTEAQKVYEKMLVTRPIVPLGNDIGYLPGSKTDKLQSWMQPIFDNLEFLLADPDNTDPRYNPTARINSLLSKGILDLEALTYIRGRSIPSHYVVIDEAQNLTPHEIKTIISRAGDGTKMVLTGDPQQIDNPYLDASSNGLSVVVEQFKGEPIHGHVTLRKSERSELAALAARLL